MEELSDFLERFQNLSQDFSVFPAAYGVGGVFGSLRRGPRAGSGSNRVRDVRIVPIPSLPQIGKNPQTLLMRLHRPCRMAVRIFDMPNRPVEFLLRSRRN